MPPVTAVLTRIKGYHPAFLEPERIYWSRLFARRAKMALEATYGWHMKRDGKYLRHCRRFPGAASDYRKRRY